ncbi:MAG: hypothetical protein EXR27_02685 [Betaproteobacteria bacterium]|nr:hypothetical protein [Betaproteobacteria bacterium]
MQSLPPYNEMVRPDAVHRAVYADASVFAAEQERIFRRTWLYVGHESEVPEPGDYILTRLALDEVMLVRQPDRSLALLHNRCAHRGARIAVTPRGNVRAFHCAYHAWSSALDGALLGVPHSGNARADSRCAHPPPCRVDARQRPASGARGRGIDADPRFVALGVGGVVQRALQPSSASHRSGPEDRQQTRRPDQLR